MHTASTSRWWDWASILLLFLIVETSATRLVSTDWTPFLHLGQTAAYIGFTVGASLGYSRFAPRQARWISFLYMLVFLPLLWTLMIDQNASLEEQFLSVGGRLFYSHSDFFARRPVEDPIFFISLTTLGFWIVSASAAFQLVRRQNYLAAVIPSAVVMLIVHGYDNFEDGRIWFLAFFAFMALLLLGRLHHLANRQSWRERRVFLSPDDNFDLAGVMTVAAGLIILVSWMPPATVSGFDSAIRAWERAAKPWRDFTQRMENAVSALESPSGGIRGEFYGSEIELGRGFPLSDAVMFRVQAPQVPAEDKPPRYYWRGRTYDHFENNQWYTTGSSLEDYSPAGGPPIQPGEVGFSRFLFQTGDLTFSLIYAPPETVWFSRQGSTRVVPAGDGKEVISWFANPSLLDGETYQVDALLGNPDTRELREAGQDYPSWVTAKYLQMPDGFSPRIIELAEEITAEQDTPYDKAAALTKYLRDNISYVDTLPEPPRSRDALEWMLFENKQAYCVYYASAEVLMLRSLGIPARLAVGFAEGERSGNEYTVRRLNAHAWPEVYFPGIGWVEFEPTGNQPALDRPPPPREEGGSTSPSLAQIPDEDLLDNQGGFLELLAEEDEETIVTQQVEIQTVNPNLYLIPSLLALAALTILLSRRYSVPDRIPVFLRAACERSGARVPAWIANWERWVNISPIERAFESVNFSLRLLDKPMQVDATPIERAKRLTNLLPKAQKEIAALLDEHQTCLYTSRDADVARARRAALSIRWRAALERMRYVLEGKPIGNP